MGFSKHTNTFFWQTFLLNIFIASEKYVFYLIKISCHKNLLVWSKYVFFYVMLLKLSVTKDFFFLKLGFCQGKKFQSAKFKKMSSKKSSE